MSWLVEQVGLRIRELRKQSGYTLEELGARLGMKGHSVWRLETGRRTPSLELIEKLGEIYGVTPDYFFEADSSVTTRPEAKELDPLLQDLWEEWNQRLHCEHPMNRDQAAAVLRAMLGALRDLEVE
ncbi:MAG: helix-turn-helix domain-containing protein [Limnochordia bacterium]|jgi:transcriptional regulator with XRE-family HTH domain